MLESFIFKFRHNLFSLEARNLGCFLCFSCFSKSWYHASSLSCRFVKGTSQEWMRVALLLVLTFFVTCITLTAVTFVLPGSKSLPFH